MSRQRATYGCVCGESFVALEVGDYVRHRRAPRHAAWSRHWTVTGQWEPLPPSIFDVADAYERRRVA